LREKGSREALTAAGVPGLRSVETGWEISDGFAAATTVLAGPDRPTALICANDRVAVGAVLAANRLGLSVPSDVSVVGYDDDENLAGPMVPALTTIALPHRRIGELAVRWVLDALEGSPDRPGTVLVPCPVVVRESVAAPAAGPGQGSPIR
jgi:LacI family transcriptional regulator